MLRIIGVVYSWALWQRCVPTLGILNSKWLWVYHEKPLRKLQSPSSFQPHRLSVEQEPHRGSPWQVRLVWEMVLLSGQTCC